MQILNTRQHEEWTGVLGRTGQHDFYHLPAYHRLDLRVDRHLVFNTWKVNAYVELINAYNRKNVSGYEYTYDSSEPTRTTTYQLPLLPFIGVEMAF